MAEQMKAQTSIMADEETNSEEQTSDEVYKTTKKYAKHDLKKNEDDSMSEQKNEQTSIMADEETNNEEQTLDNVYNAIKKYSKHDLKKNEDDLKKNDQQQTSPALQILQKYIEQSKHNNIHISDCIREFHRPTDYSEDTLLHTAALLHPDIGLLEQLVKACPSLVTISRTGSYDGQTALHITIASGKLKATKAILQNSIERSKLLESKATGSKFKQTIMLGETPLSEAALSFQIEMVKLLLDFGAKIDDVNSKGDTVIHSLIKYASIKRDKTDDVINMLQFLSAKAKEEDNKENENEKSIVETIWFTENKDGVTPLKLSVLNSLVEVFEAIMKLEDIFYFSSTVDESLDTRYYDISEIDKFSQIECKPRCHVVQTSPSILEILNSTEWKKAGEFFKVDVVHHVVSMRWRKYRCWYWTFCGIHLSALLLFTTSSYYRKYIIINSTCSSDDCVVKRKFSQTIPWILLIYAVMLLVSELYRLFGLKQGWKMSIIYKLVKKILCLIKLLCRINLLCRKKLLKSRHNTSYRFSLVVFAAALIADCFISYTETDDSNFVLILALLSGTWFCLFFLRSLKKFSYYTVLYHSVIAGDLWRFSVLIVFNFIVFSFAMWILLSENKDIEEFNDFGNITLTMFNYMLGLKDLSFLDKVGGFKQAIVFIVYILFIILAYILLLNLLIAMMSHSVIVSSETKMLRRLLQLSSVTLFLDGVFPVRRQPLTSINLHEGSGRENRIYMPITIDRIGKFMTEKDNRKNVTLKDIKKEMLGKSLIEKFKKEVLQSKVSPGPRDDDDVSRIPPPREQVIRKKKNSAIESSSTHERYLDMDKSWDTD